MHILIAFYLDFKLTKENSGHSSLFSFKKTSNERKWIMKTVNSSNFKKALIKWYIQTTWSIYSKLYVYKVFYIEYKLYKQCELWAHVYISQIFEQVNSFFLKNGKVLYSNILQFPKIWNSLIMFILKFLNSDWLKWLFLEVCKCQEKSGLISKIRCLILFSFKFFE